MRLSKESQILELNTKQLNRRLENVLDQKLQVNPWSTLLFDANIRSSLLLSITFALDSFTQNHQITSPPSYQKSFHHSPIDYKINFIKVDQSLQIQIQSVGIRVFFYMTSSIFTLHIVIWTANYSYRKSEVTSCWDASLTCSCSGLLY